MSDRQRGEDPKLFFVYDRVCTQEEKNREMGERFGVGVTLTGASREQPYRGTYADEGRRRYTEAMRDPSSAPSRPGLDASGAETGEFKKPRRSARDAYTAATAEFAGTRSYSPASHSSASGGARFAYASSGGAEGKSASENRSEQNGAGAYAYRPGRPEGGAAVAADRRKRVPDWFADIFTVRESTRGREEAKRIKKTAAAEQRAREYRHAAVTALILTAVLALASILVYKIVFVVDEVEIGGSAIYTAGEIEDAGGIGTGVGLYSFRSADVSSAVTFRLPWVKSAEVVRSAPKKVSIAVTDDVARYYAEIWGDTVLLSPALKVLSVTADMPDTAGLVRLILPPVDKSVAGRALVFSSSRAERYIRSVLSDVSDSGLLRDGMLEEIDLTGEYDIRMKACGLYDLKCGGENNMKAKLRMAHEIVVGGGLAEGIPAAMDLTAVDPVSVIHDFSAAVGP